MRDDELPMFSSTNEEIEYWRELAMQHRKERLNVQDKMKCSQKNSRVLEQGLKTQPEQVEGWNQELRPLKKSVQEENKMHSDHKDAQCDICFGTFKKEFENFCTLHNDCGVLIKRIQVLWDKLDRSKRSTLVSFHKLEERFTVLESKLGEGEVLKAQIKELKDEIRGLWKQKETKRRCIRDIKKLIENYSTEDVEDPTELGTNTLAGSSKVSSSKYKSLTTKSSLSVSSEVFTTSSNFVPFTSLVSTATSTAGRSMISAPPSSLEGVSQPPDKETIKSSSSTIDSGVHGTANHLPQKTISLSPTSVTTVPSMHLSGSSEFVVKRMRRSVESRERSSPPLVDRDEVTKLPSSHTSRTVASTKKLRSLNIATCVSSDHDVIREVEKEVEEILHIDDNEGEVTMARGVGQFSPEQPPLSLMAQLQVSTVQDPNSTSLASPSPSARQAFPSSIHVNRVHAPQSPVTSYPQSRQELPAHPTAIQLPRQGRGPDQFPRLAFPQPQQPQPCQDPYFPQTLQTPHPAHPSPQESSPQMHEQFPPSAGAPNQVESYAQQSPTALSRSRSSDMDPYSQSLQTPRPQSSDRFGQSPNPISRLQSVESFSKPSPTSRQHLSDIFHQAAPPKPIPSTPADHYVQASVAQRSQPPFSQSIVTDGTQIPTSVYSQASSSPRSTPSQDILNTLPSPQRPSSNQDMTSQPATPHPQQPQESFAPQTPAPQPPTPPADTGPPTQPGPEVERQQLCDLVQRQEFKKNEQDKVLQTQPATAVRHWNLQQPPHGHVSPHENLYKFVSHMKLSVPPVSPPKAMKKKQNKLTYRNMITQALRNYPSLKLEDIYNFISNSFSGFDMENKVWKANVRTTLSITKCYVNEKKAKQKGGFWKIRDSCMEHVSNRKRHVEK